MHFTQRILNWVHENVNCLRKFQATWAKDVLWMFRLLLLRGSPLLGSRRECETLHNALGSSTRSESARRPNHRRWCLQRTSVGMRAGAGSRIGSCAGRARRLGCEETRYRLLPLHLFPPRPHYSPYLPFPRSIPTTQQRKKNSAWSLREKHKFSTKIRPHYSLQCKIPHNSLRKTSRRKWQKTTPARPESMCRERDSFLRNGSPNLQESEILGNPRSSSLNQQLSLRIKDFRYRVAQHHPKPKER